MEPTQEQIAYKLTDYVIALEGKDSSWRFQLRNIREKFHVKEKPPFETGDYIEIMIRKVPDALPR